MKQLSLLKPTPKFYGGAIHRGRKTMRPLCSRRAIHVVLRAKKRNLFGNKAFLETEIRRYAVMFELRIYCIAVNHDHIHFMAKTPGRREYRAFIRSLTGRLARIYGKGYWSILPFTRVLEWGKDFRLVLSYLKKNQEEASGERAYELRMDWYKGIRLSEP